MSLGAVAASIEPLLVGSDVEPLSIEVPVGHIGDRVGYRYYETVWPEPELGTPLDRYIAFRDHLWKPTGADVFRVNGTGRALDRLGEARDALQVLHAQGKEEEAALYHVDLATRDVIQYERPDDAGHSEQTFGPRRGGLGAFDPWPFQSQGHNYTLGQRLPEGEELFRDAWIDFYHESGAHHDAVVLHEVRQTVSEPLLIQGEETVSIQTRGTVTFDMSLEAAQNMAGNHDHRQGLYFLHFWIPPQAHVLFTEDVWVSRAHGYPLLYASRVVINETLQSQWMAQLVVHQPGADTIAWRPPDRLGVPERNEDLLRSGDLRYPADGASRMSPTLGEAIRHATTLPPPMLRAWLALHPDAHLVGAHYGRDYGETFRWELTFGSPAGEGASVVVSQEPTTRALAAADRDRMTMRPFDPRQLPTDLVTVGELERLWAQAAGPLQAAKPINAFRWGVACDFSMYCGWRLPGFSTAWANTTDAARHAKIGFFDGDDVQGYESALLMMDLVEGHMDAYTVAQEPGWFDIPLDPPAGAAARPDTSLLEVPAAPLPRISTFALATASLLVLFLVSYFFPLLKYVFARVPIAFRGYAKLRREALLENTRRDQLLGLIRTEPGVSPPELHRRVGGGWSTIVYHLGVLERNKLVSSLVDGRNKRFFPCDTVDWGQRSRIAVLRNENTRRLYDLILANPGEIQRRLARDLGLAPPSVLWHVRRLEGAGLIRQDRDGTRVRYFASDGNQLAPLQPPT